MNFKRKLAYIKSLRTKPETPKKYILSDSDFGSNVLSLDKILESLPLNLACSVRKNLDEQIGITKEAADAIANIMKEWALSKNLRHYTHWFQPLRGNTAEKNDNFIDYCTESKKLFDRFNGSQLLKQETDGSSFPNGGLRNTFEARGYTIWNMSSPAFIFNSSLCIPTLFISYNEEALDFTTPLVKSMKILNREATKTARLFDKGVISVTSHLGWEQEFFVIDRSAHLGREDILATGRTILGKSANKGQEISDHYFGKIPERVLEFMREVEYESFRLGIPIKTRHSEVAVNQFEFAYLYADVGISVDHNALFMELMDNVARKRSLSVLFHEKPFNDMNGSGKHCNWSLSTNKGVNLFLPGENPEENLMFMSFLSCVTKSIYDYNDLLLASVSSLSNDHRLGGHEAPPNILSIFIGGSLYDTVYDDISPKETTHMTSMTELSRIRRDHNDRNRTSPFAYNGNRFEYRSVGSSANCAAPMIVIHVALAKTLRVFNEKVEKLQKEGKSGEQAAQIVVKEFFEASKDIIFNGNGYSEEWRAEAKKRKLYSVSNAAEAFSKMTEQKNIDLFEEMGVMTESEINARVEILYEEYSNSMIVEYNTLRDMVFTEIVPTLEKRIEEVLKTSKIMGKLGLEDRFYVEQAKKLGKTLNEAFKKGEELEILLKEATQLVGNKEKSFFLGNRFKPKIEELRALIDKIEGSTPDALWSILKYKEILNLK